MEAVIFFLASLVCSGSGNVKRIHNIENKINVVCENIAEMLQGKLASKS